MRTKFFGVVLLLVGLFVATVLPAFTAGSVAAKGTTNFCSTHLANPKCKPTPTPTPTPTPSPTPTTISPSPTVTTATVSPTPTTPPVGDLLASKALLYGSEWAEWDPDASQARNPAVMAKTTEAGVPIIRFSVGDCFTDMVCGNDHHTGTILRSDFRKAVQGITVDAHAALWLKMVPISEDALAGAPVGTVFCPSWSDDATLDDNLPQYKAVLDEVKAAGYTGPVVVESNNEMEYVCWKIWKSQGAPISSAGSVGVSDRIGDHYAATMPALKAYGRSLGFSQIIVGGYIGVSGGPEWGQACTASSTGPFGYSCGYSSRWINEFNNSVHNAYLANGSNPDYIPDFESIHAYPHGQDFTLTNGYEFDDNIIYSYYRNWLVQSRPLLNNIWGSAVGNNIRFSISEWNAGESNSSGTWSGWTTPGRPGQFYDGWYNMLRGDGNTTGSGTRYWNANLFLIAGNSDTGSGRFYNIIRQDGTVPDWYYNYKNQSLSDPLR